MDIIEIGKVLGVPFAVVIVLLSYLKTKDKEFNNLVNDKISMIYKKIDELDKKSVDIVRDNSVNKEILKQTISSLTIIITRINKLSEDVRVLTSSEALINTNVLEINNNLTLFKNSLETKLNDEMSNIDINNKALVLIMSELKNLIIALEPNILKNTVESTQKIINSIISIRDFIINDKPLSREDFLKIIQILSELNKNVLLKNIGDIVKSMGYVKSQNSYNKLLLIIGRTNNYICDFLKDFKFPKPIYNNIYCNITEIKEELAYTIDAELESDAQIEIKIENIEVYITKIIENSLKELTVIISESKFGTQWSD